MNEKDKNITFGTLSKLYDDIEKLNRTNEEIFKANETLAEEIEILNNIIKNTAVELEILLQSEDFELITMQLRNIVFRLKGGNKE